MKDGRGQFPGDLVHVRDHQQQTLGCGKGGGQRAGLQGTVHGTGSATFRLHFDNFWNSTPDILLAHGALDIRDFPHNRRRGNGVDGNHLVGRMSYMRRRGIAVSTNHFPRHANLL